MHIAENMNKLSALKINISNRFSTTKFTEITTVYRF